ncbi:MAG: elongation factor G [Geminicoccaceae bacterium]
MSNQRRVSNIALIGAQGTGKTTLLESLLFVSGAINRKGSVEEGSCVGDSAAEARQASMSTELNVAHIDLDDVRFCLLDTPGSVEFSQEAANVLVGVDAAVIVVDPDAERMIAVSPWLTYLDRHCIPHVIFINKMDRSDTPFRDLLERLRELSDRPIVPHHYAIGRGETLVGYIDLLTEQAYHYTVGGPSEPMTLPPEYEDREAAARAEMLETLADFDDDLLELLLEDQVPPNETVLRDLQKSLRADQVVPVFIGVASQDMGVRRLLEALTREAPCAMDTAARVGIETAGESLVQVLKTIHTPHAGKLCVVRVWRGSVEDGGTIAGERIGGVYQVFGARHDAVGKAFAGEVVGLGRLEQRSTGDIVGPGGAVDMPTLPKPMRVEPVFAQAVRARHRGDEVKLSEAFTKLADEDPSLRFVQDQELGEAQLWGQGEMHLRVALERLRNKFKVDVDTFAPQTAYRETIRKRTEAHGRHKKQSGGHGQFADVKITIEPLERGGGFAFNNKVVGGSVPKSYIPAVEAGSVEYLRQGPLGFPVVDVAVTLFDGQAHSVDSSELAFKLAVGLALREGLPACDPVLLEPVVQATVSVPSAYTSKVLQLVSGKRGQILGYDAKPEWPKWDEIAVQLPQSEIYDLIQPLRALSQGVGFFTWQFDHLQPAPDTVAKKVVAERKEALKAA